MSKFDYKNTNLNKLTTTEIETHKKKMDENFSKNQLKPGDSGFEYDKRVEFKPSTNTKMDTSWDENDNDYFDDDFQ